MAAANRRQPPATAHKDMPKQATVSGNRQQKPRQRPNPFKHPGCRTPAARSKRWRASRLPTSNSQHPKPTGAALSCHDPSDPAKNSGPTRIRSEPHRSQSSPQYPPTSRRRSLQRTGYLSLPTRNPKLEPRWPNQARKVGPAIPRARPCPKRPFRSQEELQGKFLQR